MNITGYLTSTLRIIGVAVGDWEESAYHQSRYDNRDSIALKRDTCILVVSKGSLQ